MLNAIKTLYLFITFLSITWPFPTTSQQEHFFTSQNDTIQIWSTYYYIPSVKHSGNGLDILNKEEQPTGFKLDSCNWCSACIEGTVSILKDSTYSLFNYAGRSKKLQHDCRECEQYKNYSGYSNTGRVLWTESKHYGKGVQNLNLVPFKTIAVDPSIIPHGSVLFIPNAVGTKYILNKDTLTHDGYFFAGDTGSKIKGNHIDTFTGFENSNIPSFISSDSTTLSTAIFITDSLKIQELTQLHIF